MSEFIMEGGVGMKLEVFEDKVILYSYGLITQKLKNTKTIPYTSILSIDFRESGSIFPGYIKFLLPRNENMGILDDILGAIDDNRFDFSGQNEMANNIKNYIEKQVVEIQKKRLQ
jgi:hypothetical protein